MIDNPAPAMTAAGLWTVHEFSDFSINMWAVDLDATGFG